MNNSSLKRPVAKLLLLLTLSVGVGLALAAAATQSSRRHSEPASTMAPDLNDNFLLAQGQEFIDTTKPFSHGTHLGKKVMDKNGGKAIRCEECHSGMVDKQGQCPTEEVRFPTHETCAKCHAANFYTQPLTICVNCHTSMEMRKGNPLKDLGRQVTPRKAAFNHKQHLIAKGSARKKTGKKLDCTSCHKPKKKGKIVTNPSHPNCCQCHTDDKLEVQMKNCSQCHSQSKAVKRPVSKIHSFTHAKHHMVSKEGESMRCSTCHTNGHMAKTIRQIKVPPMSSCVGCHDGNHTWHFSSCLKCHKEGTMAGPIPKSHQNVTPPPKDPEAKDKDAKKTDGKKTDVKAPAKEGEGNKK